MRDKMPNGSLSWLATRWVTPDGLLSIFSLLESRGQAIGPARQAGKLPSDFDARCPRVSFLAAAEVWRYASGAYDDPALGVRAAEQSLRREPGLVDYLVRASPTLAQGLADKARFAPVDDELRRCTFTVREDRASFAFHGSASIYLPACAEYVAARLVGLVRQLSDGALRPECVRFLHGVSGSTSAQRQFFGAPITFRAETFEVVYPLAALRQPSRTGDPGLYKLLLSYAEQKLDEVMRPRCTAERVRELVSQLWQPGHGAVPTRGDVARALSVTPRTLSRWLEAEGKTYVDVLDEFRALSAVRSLQKPEVSLGQLAERLGFKDQSAFTHAFRRWTGMTPGQYRRLYAVRPQPIATPPRSDL